MPRSKFATREKSESSRRQILKVAGKIKIEEKFVQEDTIEVFTQTLLIDYKRKYPEDLKGYFKENIRVNFTNKQQPPLGEKQTYLMSAWKENARVAKKNKISPNKNRVGDYFQGYLRQSEVNI